MLGVHDEIQPLVLEGTRENGQLKPARLLLASVWRVQTYGSLSCLCTWQVTWCLILMMRRRYEVHKVLFWVCKVKWEV